jgi:hypothetical protein
MKKWILVAALAIFGLSTSEVNANPLQCKGPFCTGNKPFYGSSASGCLGFLCHKQGPILPVYQAAPWYLYWPYDAHFMTPAPVYGQYFAPPTFGYGGNAYFPMQHPAYIPGSPINHYPMSPIPPK